MLADRRQLDVEGFYADPAVGDRDARAVAEIMTKAGLWMVAHGQRSWPVPHSINAVKRRINAGSVYLVKTEEIPETIREVEIVNAATFTLLDRDDQKWTDCPQDALIVCGLAVRPIYMHREVGSAALRLAKIIAAERNCEYVRLDCAVDNVRLRSYFEAQGFQLLPDEVHSGRYVGARYQAPVA